MEELRAADAYRQLVEAVKTRRCVLFAGAGLSMAVGLPSWSQLIGHMRSELGLSKDETDADYQSLAEYYRLKFGSIGALRSWMDRSWSVSEAKVARSKVHELIVRMNFPIVYTTNYDNNLEVAYELAGRRFVKIANAHDLARAEDGCSQIVKFHGDFEADDSLVLAETDYFDRLEFDSPLDVKFRADALGRTILFIGYSMSDMNIRLLLHKLWRTWDKTGRIKNRPPSFVFSTRADPVRDAVLEQWGLSMLSGTERDPEKALVKFLSQLANDVCAPAKQPA